MTETYVVVSKVKKMIREKFELNTSQSAIDTLSSIVEKECIKAAQKAKEANRKTVLDRDFPETI
ncbi:MAG: hypothetical protein WC688_03670 [Parachlamydiales bacterium]|jgi:histone H3/H4